MLFYLINFLAFAKVILAVCYDIHDNVITSPDYLPCNSISGTISMCCATNRGPSNVYPPDTCLPNGLCQNIFSNLTTGKPDTNYWREGCSSSGWSGQYCLSGVCASTNVRPLSHHSHLEQTKGSYAAPTTILTMFNRRTRTTMEMQK